MSCPRPPISATSRYGPQDDGPRGEDDLLLAISLTAWWMLHTGRLLDHRPVLHHLDSEALIDFWADDHIAWNGDPARPKGTRQCAACPSR